jgi:alpha-N-arabinofuranosidase
MKTRAAQGALVATALCLACAAHGQSREVKAPLPIVATIDAQQTAPPVSKYEFGMFIEHIRTLIYRSLWSEMLRPRNRAAPSVTCSFANGARLAPTKSW